MVCMADGLYGLFDELRTDGAENSVVSLYTKKLVRRVF